MRKFCKIFMVDSAAKFAFPFHIKIDMEETEEVPMQNIHHFKNVPTFTREDFDQAKKNLESSNNGEVKGFKYDLCPPSAGDLEKKSNEKTPASKHLEEKRAFSPSPFLSPKSKASPGEQKTEQDRLPSRHWVRPILRPLLREEDIRDEDASYLIRRYNY